MTIRGRRRWGAAAAGLATIVALVAMVAGGSAATAGKPYAAAISPTSVAPGVSTFTYSVTNLDAQQLLGSVRISIPSGVTLRSPAPTILSSPTGKSWVVKSVTSTYIEADAASNSARLGKNDVVRVSFGAEIPCGGPFVFQSAAHQANQFQGPNNEFTQANADSNRTVAVSGSGTATSLSIDAVATPQEAGVSFPVTVRAFDQCGSPAQVPASPRSVTGFGTSPNGTAMTSPVAADNGTSVRFDVKVYKADAQPLTVTAGSLSQTTSSSVTVVPGVLGSFTFDSLATSQTAGSPIGVVVHPFDLWGNAKTNYAGGAMLGGNLGTASGTQPPGVTASQSPTYGSLTWAANGDGSGSVVAKKAETGAAITVTDGAVNATSGTFAVVHGALSVWFANQPRATVPGATILSTAGTAIAVDAADDFGNVPVASDNETVALTSQPVASESGILAGGGATSITGGQASLGGLSIGVANDFSTVGNYQLRAALSSGGTASSNVFPIVYDASLCTGTVCTSVAGNGNQTSSAKITTSGSFDGVVLTTTFLGTGASHCDGFSVLQGTSITDVSVSGGNVSASQPTFSVISIIPKATLQAAGQVATQRSADGWNLCVGAKRLDGGSGAWTTKSGAQATGPDSDGFYWGVAPDCSSSLPVGNPCVRLKTKNLNELLAYTGGTLPAGVTFANSDLALVLELGYPWDLRVGTGG
jgi:hypothetical protein